MAYLSLTLSREWGPGELPKAVDVTTVDGETLRYVPERTCLVVRGGEPSPTGVPRELRCSECGGRLSRFGSYCQSCGARVVEARRGGGLR